MQKDMISKALVLGVICLFIGVGFQSAFAVEPKLSTNNIQFEEDIEPKDYLFETIIEISNNPEVKELFEEYKHNIFDLIYSNNDIDKQILLNNPKLFLTLLFTKPQINSEYLNFAYDKGSDILNIIGDDEALEMIKSIDDSDFEILKNFNHIITSNEDLSNRVTLLSELNENLVICSILWVLVWVFFGCGIILGNIYNLNQDGIIWTIIFLPPILVCLLLTLITLEIYFELDCMPYPY
jgi:hypothetical protein